MEIKKTLELLESQKADSLFADLYGQKDVAAQKERYKEVIREFEKEFGEKDILLFSSPGRTEPWKSIGRKY